MSIEKDDVLIPLKTTCKLMVADACISAVFSAGLYPTNTVWTIQQTRLNNQFPTMWQAIRHAKTHRSWFVGFPVSAASDIPGTFMYLSARGIVASYFGNEGYMPLLQSLSATACGMIFWAPGMRVAILQQASATNGKKRKSAIQYCQQIVKAHGVRDLYRGTSIYYGVFTASDLLGTFLQCNFLNRFDKKQQHRWDIQLFATLLGFGMSACLTAPVEAALFPYMSQEIRKDFMHKKTLSMMTSNLYKTYGIKGFLRGMPIQTFHLSLWHAIIPLKQKVSERAKEDALIL